MSKKKISQETFDEVVKENIEELARVLTSEVGKPLQQSRNEVNGACTRIKWLTENSEKYLSDPLSHMQITARLFWEVQRTAKRLLQGIEASVPFLMMLAGDERLVRRDLSELFFDRLQCSDKTKKVYNSFYHEILNEVERRQVLKDLIVWIEKKL